jgi:hypothetical protein
MENDANERYEKRKLNEKLANEFKDKGNFEFAKSNYDKAIEYYTEVCFFFKNVFQESFRFGYF